MHKVQRKGGSAAQQLGRGLCGWLTLAADQDHADAQYMLGRMYIEGLGAAADPAFGLRWLHRAANLKHPAAMMLIGDAYLDGLGVAKDEVEAYYWYARAADIDNAFNEERDALGEKISPKDRIDVQKRLIRR